MLYYRLPNLYNGLHIRYIYFGSTDTLPHNCTDIPRGLLHYRTQLDIDFQCDGLGFQNGETRNFLW